MNNDYIENLKDLRIEISNLNTLNSDKDSNKGNKIKIIDHNSLENKSKRLEEEKTINGFKALITAIKLCKLMDIDLIRFLANKKPYGVTLILKM